MASPPITPSRGAAPSLVITVDTEPDDQWAPPGPDGLLPPFAFANTRGLGRLADFLHGRGVPTTWMTSYTVARDAESARVLRRLRDRGDELAGHLHGWETAPYSDIDRRHEPFIYEYDAETRLAKHRVLWESHCDAFDAPPVSYRAGRWGVDDLELEHLAELGYRIDSSVPPGIDFRDRRGLHALGPDFRHHLRPGGPHNHHDGRLWHVPASVFLAGRLGDGPAATRLAHFHLDRSRPRSVARGLSAVLERTGLSELRWIRPSKHPAPVLARATRTLLRRGAPIVNVMTHSSEAFLGTSPWSRTEEEVERFYADLGAIVDAALDEGAVGRTLEAAVEALPATRK